MLGIPPSLYERLKDVLSRCEAFDSDANLAAEFVDGRISAWADDLPNAGTKSARVKMAIRYLWRKRNHKRENALILLLDVLADGCPSTDSRKSELEELATELRAVTSAVIPPLPVLVQYAPYVLVVVLIIAVIIYLLTRPRLTIDSHVDGDIVEREAVFSGTYRNLREGWTVWSLVYPEDNYYWVQGYWDVTQPNGEWQSKARIGMVDTRDIGHTFEFIVLAVRKGSDAERVLRTAYNREQNYIDELPTGKKAIDAVTVVRGSPTGYWLADFWADDDKTASPVTTTQITSPYLFQEWWGAPFDGMPEEGWTARFARRIDLPRDGEYCFYRVQDGGADVALNGAELAFSYEMDDNPQVGAACQTLQAGLHDVRVDLTDTSDPPTSVELWYDGPGLPVPTGPLTETWQATFYPLPELIGTPVLRTSLPGDMLDFSGSLTGNAPVVHFSAVFSRTFTLSETGTYRFVVHVDDGARLSICGVEVLDEVHGGPGYYTVDRVLEAGDHTLYLEYYEHYGDQYAKIAWQRILDPILPVQRILYLSNRDNYGDEIFVADADGSNPQQLTHNTYPDRDPAWSPDGQRIVFAAAPEADGVFNLYVMDADGSDPQLLVRGGGQPRWSPDGSRIVFARWISEGEQHLWLINADGTGELPLTEGQAVNYNPDWSPDGAQIAFESYADGGGEIYVINADGSNLHNISNSPETWDGTPAWSPDGETIAFASYRENNTDIYIMNTDGSDVRRVTWQDTEDACPDWSPDGRFLVFHGGDAWWRQIYKVDPYSDADRIALTDANGRHEKPQWSPPAYGYAFADFTDGDAVNASAIAVTQDAIWTGGSGGLMRWSRDDPEGRNDPDEQRKVTAAEDGLPGNDIRTILPVDSETLWLSVGQWPFYDEGWGQLTLGETGGWRTFTPGDGLDAQQIFVLYRDRQERIWAGTSNGLWMVDGQKWQPWLPSLGWVTEIVQASDGALWLETPGPEVRRYVPTVPGDDTSEAFDLMALLESENDGFRYVSAIVEGQPGELWFGSNAGVVRYDGETWEVPDDELRRWVYDIVRDDDGTLWIGIDGWEGKRLLRRNPDGELRIYAEDEGLTTDIKALVVDDAGVLWAAGDALYRYDREADTWTAYWAHDDEEQNHASAIFQDTQGALWFGHSIFYRSGDENYIWRDGVSRTTPDNTEVWQSFDKGAVHAMAQDNKGVLWFGFDADGGGVCPYEIATGQWYACSTTGTSPLESNDVDAILPTRDGALWFGTSGGGLTRAYGEFWQTFRPGDTPLLSDNVHCLVQDDQGALWITTDKGVNRLLYENRLWGTFDSSHGLVADEVLAVALDGQDGIWFGTKAGLSHYNYVTQAFTNITDGPKMPGWAYNCQQRLLVDRYGTLWVATDEGLYRRTPEDGWIRLTTANGLASNHILAIDEDADGDLWAGTPYGISRVEVTALEP